MAQVIDFNAARAAAARRQECGLARLADWKALPDGRRERKEHGEMRARAAKPFQFGGVL